MPAFPSLPVFFLGVERRNPQYCLSQSGVIVIGLGPLFAGDTDLDQLGRVVAVLGSIDVQDWPEVTALPDFGKVPSGFNPSLFG